MALRICLILLSNVVTAASLAQGTNGFDAAAAFGARQTVTNLTLSPDGLSVAYVAPGAGPESALVTLGLAKGETARVALRAAGKPERIESCHWVSNERLVCTVYGLVQNAIDLLEFTRVVAVDRSGANFKLLSTRANEHTRGLQLGGGSVIDWLPGEDSAVLMTRVYLPDDHLGTRIGSAAEGVGVDRLDTRNLQVKPVEKPVRGFATYISDGHGTVRIMAVAAMSGAARADSGISSYSYRKRGSREWLKLGDYNAVDKTGFEPRAVDPDLNIAYGFKKKDGRQALYSIALDGSLRESLVYARPDVDVDGLVRIGRRNRVVGVSYATDVRTAFYFDPDIDKLMKSLSRALPRQPLVSIVDSSDDERVLLVFAGSDDDPGVYYLFDRASKQLRTFLVTRSELEGVTLARVKSISYRAADGEVVPGYLTLPPGMENAKGLPAIVLPHGGPAARDEWGFDWLSQYYASRGFAVLQPNFRGSAGFGDAWLQRNGFQSWRIAVGDVVDAGRWLVAQGIADPAKLCVVGWSYGGYAALQSAVIEPGIFKAVVAIAPVTDLAALKEEWRNWSNFYLVSDYIGVGPHIREGSPAQNAEKIKVPVLLFHGALDRNVGIAQSRLMAARLESAGVKHDLVTWEGLDHYLEDSTARAQLLRQSDAFIRQVIGVVP